MNRTMTTPLAKRLKDLYPDRSGITGLETAIVLIAFVVVAAVFAFTVLTTGLFTSEKAKETAMSGVSSQSSLELVGSVIAGGNNLGDACTTASAVAGAPVTSDPPFENMAACDVDWNGWDADPPTNHVQTIRFKIAPAMGVTDVPFDPSEVLITYSDGQLAELFTFATARPRVAGDPVTTDNADIRDHTANSLEWDRCRDGGLAGQNYPSFCISWSPNADRDFVLEAGEWVEIFLFSPDNGNLPGIPLNRIHSTSAWNPGTRFMIEVIPQQGAVLSFKRRLPDVFRWVNDLG